MSKILGIEATDEFGAAACKLMRRICKIGYGPAVEHELGEPSLDTREWADMVMELWKDYTRNPEQYDKKSDDAESDTSLVGTAPTGTHQEDSDEQHDGSGGTSSTPSSTPPEFSESEIDFDAPIVEQSEHGSHTEERSTQETKQDDDGSASGADTTSLFD